MKQNLLVFMLMIFTCAYAQVPKPGTDFPRENVDSPEQNILYILLDSTLLPRLFSNACPNEAYLPDLRMLVYDSTAHLPEPIMVYRLAHENLKHEQLIEIAESHEINFYEKQKLNFDLYTSTKVHFTNKARDFRKGYYFVRFSNIMQYENALYIDVWIKEKSDGAGMNILFKTDLNGRVLKYRTYKDCRSRG